MTINDKYCSEVGIYKRKQENSTKKAIKKTREQELDRESDQEKKQKLYFFLITLPVEFLFSLLSVHSLVGWSVLIS